MFDAFWLPNWRDITFELPQLLWLIPLPLLVYLLVPAAKARVAALRVPYEEVKNVQSGFSLGKGKGPGLLAWLAWACLCVAAALPRVYGPPVNPPALGRDLMMVLDLSASMSSEDMIVGAEHVDRLTAAKAVLGEFLNQREGDRIGLVVFGTNAYVMTPLTRDLKTVNEQLASTAHSMAGPATSIGDAIALAVKRLDEENVPQKVVILLTDGYTTAGRLTPDEAADIAARAGVKIYTIGFGDDASLTLFGFKIPIGGAPVDIDEAALQRMAKATNGKFYRARETQELLNIYNDIQRLEPITRQTKTVRPVISLYYWPLSLAFGFALSAFLLNGLLKRRIA